MAVKAHERIANGSEDHRLEWPIDEGAGCGAGMIGYGVGSLLRFAKAAKNAEGQLLAKHLEEAVKRFAEKGFTKAQAARLATNPRLEPAFRGERIDKFFKELVQADPNLQHLQVTPRRQVGPDVFDPVRRFWYDVTTPGQWLNHVQKYLSFGQRIPLFH